MWLASWRALPSLLSELFNDPGHSIVELVGDIESCKLIYVEAALRLAEELFIVKLSTKDCIDLGRFEPFYTLAFLPESALCLLAWNEICTETVLLAAAPMT